MKLSKITKTMIGFLFTTSASTFAATVPVLGPARNCAVLGLLTLVGKHRQAHADGRTTDRYRTGRRRMALVGTLALVALTSPAPALMIIDNFSAPVMGVEDPPGGTFATSTLENQIAIDCIGGFRKITVDRVTGTTGSVIFAANSPLYTDKAAMYMSGSSTGKGVIEYGSFTAGAGDLNADFSGNHFFGITFVDLNEAIDMVITVTNAIDGEVSFSTNVPEDQNNDRFSVLLSDFPDFDFSDVDGLRYEFIALTGSTSMTIEFLDISRIPEPASIALFGMLILTLLHRRRRGCPRSC